MPSDVEPEDLFVRREWARAVVRAAARAKARGIAISKVWGEG